MNILDRRFVYTPSHKTTPDYLRARMAEWRRQVEAERQRKDPNGLSRLAHELGLDRRDDPTPWKRKEAK